LADTVAKVENRTTLKISLRDLAGTALQFDGDLQIARAFPVWLRFETMNRARVVNARSGAGKYGGKPRKIGEGRAIRSGERPGI
jgi:hypothetical protein